MLKQTLKGLATYVPGLYAAFSKKNTGGTVSARYCYSVWLRHLVTAHQNGLSVRPSVVAELGPGDSLGSGLAALLTGADKYFAFDVVKYTDIRKNLTIFDELVTLFRERADIPADDEFPGVIPKLDTYAFPTTMLSEAYLEPLLLPERLDAIRNAILSFDEKDSMIQYKVPWQDDGLVESGSVDLVFSQAVLEHVNQVPSVYHSIFSWLKPGGYMSHAIDYRCHGCAKEWNGHWTYSDFNWKLIMGKRPFLINRLPHSNHLKLIEKTGFKLVCNIPYQLPSKIGKSQLAAQFRDMPPDDMVTSTAFVQAQTR